MCRLTLEKCSKPIFEIFLGSVSLSVFFLAIFINAIYYFANVHENH